ncbi:hypothetical protein predicted by Glimmer/Critica [Lactiplantibacillus plantarum]|nr:hypothetical protein predicted by Glimmer/Critica [Lactiplantibacillus plantarum]
MAIFLRSYLYANHLFVHISIKLSNIYIAIGNG